MNTSAKSSVIYMLRTAQQHHVQLSMMADQKASALIAACFVTLSILATYMASHKASVTLLIVMGFAILSAWFAVLAVLPRLRGNTPAGDRNLLFLVILRIFPWMNTCARRVRSCSPMKMFMNPCCATFIVWVRC